MVRGISQQVYDFVISADRAQLGKMQKELSHEITSGLLDTPPHRKELELIESRLRDIN